jgi:plasmid stabilization system protein ParE
VPRLSWTPAALRDIQRLHRFLAPKSPDAAKRAVKAIREGVRVLGLQPGIGRPVDDMPEAYREWFIHFGASGYTVRYRLDLGTDRGMDGGVNTTLGTNLDANVDTVTVLAVWHQKEAGM